MQLSLELFNQIQTLLHKCDGELSATAHRGTFDKDEFLELSQDCRDAAKRMENVRE